MGRERVGALGVVHRVQVIDRLKSRILHRLIAGLAGRMAPELAQALLSQPRIYGPPERLHIAPSAVVNDGLFNLSSGEITVGEWAMLGHGVMVLTGTHDVTKFGPARQTAAPRSGYDVVIADGAWLASGVTVLGPCHIGAHAVVAAGSLVRQDVAAYAIVAGVPAQVVGQVDPSGPALDPGWS